MINHLSAGPVCAGPVYIQYLNWSITVPADALAPILAIPTAVAILIIDLDMILSRFIWQLQTLNTVLNVTCEIQSFLAINNFNCYSYCRWRFQNSSHKCQSLKCWPCSPGPCLNIKTIFPMYGGSHVKDKTVCETVLSLTCESLYW